MPASSSSTIVLHGFLLSSCTQTVLATLAELELDYKFEVVNLQAGEQQQEKHKRLQPWGKVPALTDGSLTLYESRAIATYLASKYPDGNKALLPTEVHERAIHEQWVSIERSYITPHITPIMFQRLVTKFRGLTCDEKVVETAAAELKKSLATFNSLLEGKQYVTGDTFTLADLFYLPYFQALSATPEWSLVEAQPNVLAWWKCISSRPSWVHVRAKVEELLAKIQANANTNASAR